MKSIFDKILISNSFMIMNFALFAVMATYPVLLVVNMFLWPGTDYFSNYEGVNVYLYSFLVTCLLVSLLHLLSVSFITEWWHRSFCQGRKIANREEREFAHIIDDICKKARIKRPTILVNNDESVNAYALGRRTIVLNKGCFTLIDRDQLAAIIAHEIAHLKVGDSVCSISAITMLSVPLFSERFPRLINVIGVFFKPAKLLHLLSLPLLPAYWLFNYLFLPLWNPLIILIGRRAEFRADALAAKWVGKKKVISLLEYLEKNNVEQDGNMWGRLYESHPFTIYRLDNVDALQD